jgi:hypothetical protein
LRLAKPGTSISHLHFNSNRAGAVRIEAKTLIESDE